MNNEPTKNKLTVYAPGSEEAKKVFRSNTIIYGCSGTPMASIYYVFPDWPTFEDKSFKDTDEDYLKELNEIADKLKPIIDEIRHEQDVEKVEAIFRQHSAILHEIDETEIAAVLNEALSESEEFFGCQEAKVLIEALQKVDGDRFGSSASTHYTYNDPDSYLGHRDLQITWSNDGDFYPSDVPLVFVQIHPGGDARNMASGYFYVPEAINDFSDIFGTLGEYEGNFGADVEIPAAFPMEEYLQKHHHETWERVYFDDDDNKALPRYEPHGGMCKVSLRPESYYGASADSYRMVEPFEFGNDLWSWHPTGVIIGEMEGQWGVSATPWKKAEYQYSTGGYFEWEGPQPGTDEWAEMLKELDLEEAKPVKIDDPNQKTLSL